MIYIKSNEYNVINNYNDKAQSVLSLSLWFLLSVYVVLLTRDSFYGVFLCSVVLLRLSVPV